MTMLDAFLEVVHGKTKQAEAEEKLVSLLEKLPSAILEKVASGELTMDKLAYCTSPSCSGGSWIEQFQGSPLLDQAIAIEREALEIQMTEARIRQMQNELRQQGPNYDDIDMQQQQLAIRRKLLELELVGSGEGDAMGGQEGEDAAPPVDLEAVEAESLPQVPKAEAPPQEEAGPPVAMEEELPVEEEEAPPQEESEEGESKEKPKDEKPKTEKTTTVTKEKPVDEKEKIDIKAAAARMKEAARCLPLDDEKIAGVVKAKGTIGRGFQLLTGSRARALEGQAADRGKSLARNVASSNRTMHAAVMGGDDVAENVAQKAIRAGHTATMTARGGQLRSAREAVKERAAVSAARKDVGKAALGVGAGMGTAAGAMSLGSPKTASAVDAMGATVAAGSKKIRAATQAVQNQVKKNNTPLMTRGQKMMAGGAALGLGGGMMAGGKQKQAHIMTTEEVEQVKEAFGAAVLQGLKGMGQFAGTAGKSVLNAAKAGGPQAALQAAGNAGRAGMARAGNFISQNPGAGAALVAAPAMAAGYAAGRQ